MVDVVQSNNKVVGAVGGVGRIETNGKVARRVIFYKSELDQLMDKFKFETYSRSDMALAMLKELDIVPDVERTPKPKAKADTTQSGEIALSVWIEELTKLFKQRLDDGKKNSPEYATKVVADSMAKYKESQDKINQVLAHFQLEQKVPVVPKLIF